MAGMVPLISAGITAGSAIYGTMQSKKMGEKADARAAKDAKQQNAMRADQAKDQNKKIFEERKQSGARKRIMSMRSDGKSGSLFSNSGFGGAPAQTTMG